MKKNLFEISQEEKERLLNLHETATKKQYLNIIEQRTPNFEDDYGSFVYLSDTLNPKKVKKNFEDRYGVPFEVRNVGDKLKVSPKRLNEQDGNIAPSKSHIPDVKDIISKTVNFYSTPVTSNENYYGTAKITDIDGLSGVDVKVNVLFDEGTGDEISMNLIMVCEEYSKNPNSGFLTKDKRTRYYNKALNKAIGDKFCKAPTADFQAGVNKQSNTQA